MQAFSHYTMEARLTSLYTVGLFLRVLVCSSVASVLIGETIKNNIWMFLFFLLAGISFTWSDYPFVTFKRFVKAMGDIVIVLVLWSDPAPVRAITLVIRRCGYILIPLSLLFCKYYEHLGRKFDSWGRTSYVGVTLRQTCSGICFFYSVYFLRRPL